MRLRPAKARLLLIFQLLRKSLKRAVSLVMSLKSGLDRIREGGCRRFECASGSFFARDISDGYGCESSCYDVHVSEPPADTVLISKIPDSELAFEVSFFWKNCESLKNPRAKWPWSKWP